MRFRVLIPIAMVAAAAATGIRALETTPSSPAAPAGNKTAGNTPAAANEPDVATLLFSKPEWSLVPAGSTLTYNVSKTTSDPSFGPGFDDHITLDVSGGDNAQSRSVAVKMFSGPQAVPAGPFPSDTQNPVLLLFLEYNVQELSKSFQANPRYLKNAIRKAWREKARIEPAQIDIDGKSVTGTRVTVQPFLGDAQAERMKGLDNMTYIVEVADSVPGAIATIDIHGSGKAGEKFAETLHFAALKTP